jgi:DNA polymerase (family X)
MTKEEIAGALEQIATLLELKNENPFKIRAYTNAARAIETFGGNVANFQDEEALSKIPGIGKSIALKINELAATGSLKYLEELSAEFPSGILELFSLPGLGAKKIKALYHKLQISSIEHLQKACESGRASLKWLVLVKQPSKSFGTSLQDVQRTPVHFNSGRSQQKRKRCGLIWRRMTAPCRSI